MDGFFSFEGLLRATAARKCGEGRMLAMACLFVWNYEIEKLVCQFFSSLARTKAAGLFLVVREGDV
jgi:hypothetical protein